MTILREQVVKRFSRASGWSKLRKLHLLDHPSCKICTKRKGLEVHHVIPVHVDASRELDPTNLMTLCRRHHFIFGHLEYWKSYNSYIEKTSACYSKVLKGRP